MLPFHTPSPPAIDPKDTHAPIPVSDNSLLKQSIHTMSFTLRCPPENTMAFGGVATGNMKANEQEMAAGSMRYHG